MDTIRVYLNISILIILGSIFSSDAAGQSGIDTIHYNGPVDEYINIVILGDGYTAANHSAGKFISDATSFANKLFEYEPFTDYENYFNVFAIKKNSAEEGADHPQTANDESDPPDPVKEVETYYSSTFDYNNIHRLLVPINTSIMYSDLGTEFPNWNQIVLLVNDPEYGGSGGAIATASTHPSSGRIAVHEIGHSFASLADEYYAGDFYARESINMTKETNPELVLWNKWHGDEGTGIYQHCCGGNSSMWYRPHQSCMMRSISNNFCAVCKEAVINKIYSLVDPIIDSIPQENLVTVTGPNSMMFGGEFINTISGHLFEWTLNHTFLPNRVNQNEEFTASDFNPGSNSLILTILDTTNMSRSYQPGEGYVYTITWNIIKEPCPEDYTLSGNHQEDITYNASQWISSVSMVLENHTTYKAGVYIELQSGFAVEDGAIFTVLMGGCE